MNLDLLKIVILTFCVIAVFFDLRLRKVPNRFILVSLTIIFITAFSCLGWKPFVSNLLSVGMVFILGYLLWRFRVLGAGDVKVMAIATISLQWVSGLEFCFYSLAWGSLLGVISLMLEKGLVGVANKFSFNSIVTIRTLGFSEHKIPFTVAILLGILSTWLLETKGVHFL